MQKQISQLRKDGGLAHMSSGKICSCHTWTFKFIEKYKEITKRQGLGIR